MNDGKTQPIEFRGTGFYVGLGAILLFAVILLILAVQNTQNVTIDFLGWNFTIPLFGVAIGAALIAIVIDELVGLVWRRRRRSLLAERAELESLRAAEPSIGSDVDLGEQVPESSIDSPPAENPETPYPKPGEPEAD
jgi:uncharacterized integral membrane protein